MFSEKARPVAWPLFFFYFFFCAFIGVMMPYISLYYKSIGLTASEIGRLMSTFTLSGILIPHFWAVACWDVTTTVCCRILLD
jgi:PPP family 3-phenylpropionic acid transporter